MADFVNREVSRARLHKACNAGTTVSVLLMLVGCAYGAAAALVATNMAVPGFVATVLHTIVPTLADTALAIADCATRAVIFVLMGLVGVLMFRQVARHDDAFRVEQMRQLRFIALLVILLGFLPSLVGNAAKVALATQGGRPVLSELDLAVDGMCILGGLILFMAARMLVAASVLAQQDGGFVPRVSARRRSAPPTVTGPVTSGAPIGSDAPAEPTGTVEFPATDDSMPATTAYEPLDESASGEEF